MTPPNRRRSSRAASAGALALTLVVALVACGEPTGPDKGLSITLSALADSTTEYTVIEETPAIICEFPIVARTTGNGAGRWTGATTRIFSGPDRRSPVDTAVVDAGALSAAFGVGSLFGPGDQQAMVRAVFLLPFEIEVEVRYDVSGRPKKSSLRLPCGPRPPANVPPPVIGAVEVSGPQNLYANDIVRVNVAASSGYGLWETVIRVTGPFTAEHRFAESASTTTARLWNFTVPDTAAPESPVVITVLVTDALGNTVRRDSTTTKAMRDTAPPVMTGVALARVDGDDHVLQSDGQFSRYDLLGVTVRATDDLGLGWLVIEVDAPVPVRDSVPLRPHEAEQQVRFQVQPSWAGGRSVAIRTTDRVGRMSALRVVTPPDSLRFFAFAERPVVRLNLPTGAREAVFDPVRRRFYLSDEGAARIQVVDATTMTLLAPIPIAARGLNLDVTTSGDTLLVAYDDLDQLGIVDLRGASPVLTAVPLRVPPIGGGTAIPVRIFDVKWDASGRLVLLAATESAANDVLFTLDLGTNTAVWIDDGRPVTPPGELAQPTRLVASPDRSRLWAMGGSCSRWYTAANRMVGPCVYVPVFDYNQNFPSVSPDGTELAIGEEFRNADLQRSGRPSVSLNGWNRMAQFTPAGTEIWSTEDWLYDRVRASDHRRIERLGLPIRARRMWLEPSGAFLYVYDLDRTAIIRVDLR